MKRLDEKNWAPVPVADLFDKPVAGKGKGLNHLVQTDKIGVCYIGATNRNNGVLCFIKPDEVSKNMMQPGNCIGFIKNGDGSAGYAIYKHESFISTSDVIYGYAGWVNEFTGLFFVAAQDKIKNKYSHGYKRNEQHLHGDKVMLPITGDGRPDYAYMYEYVRDHRKAMLSKYRAYVAKQISDIGNYVDIPELRDKEWGCIAIPNIFSEIQRGKRLKNADHVPGNTPYVSSTANNNGVDDYVTETEGTRVFKYCISLANSGSVGTAFYEPFAFVASDHITHMKRTSANKYLYLFLAAMLEKQKGNFSFNREINDVRIRKLQIMLPVTDSRKPDYKYMEQYAKNMMLKKYKQYLMFLEAKEKETKA